MLFMFRITVGLYKYILGSILLRHDLDVGKINVTLLLFNYENVKGEYKIFK